MVWKPGESGNTGGKPKETRNRLSNVFLRALLVDFEENGVDAIDRVRKNDPGTYLRVIASIVPKELELTNPLSDVTEEQLGEIIASLRSAISAGVVRSVASPDEGGKPLKSIPPVH